MAQSPLAMPPEGPMGPASGPTGDPGLVAQAMTQVREAINMLQMSLPALPVGSDVHKDVLDAISKLSKSVPASAQIPGVQSTTLAGLQQQAQETAVLQQLMKAMGGGEGGAPVPPVQAMM